MWPRPRPDSCGTATPQAATSGASGSVILSPTPPVECLSAVGRDSAEKSIRSPDAIIAAVQRRDLAAVHAVEQDRHRQRRHLLVGDVAPRVGVDDPVDLAVGQGLLVALGDDHLDRVVAPDSSRAPSTRVRSSGPNASGSTSDIGRTPETRQQQQVGPAVLVEQLPAAPARHDHLGVLVDAHEVRQPAATGGVQRGHQAALGAQRDAVRRVLDVAAHHHADRRRRAPRRPPGSGCRARRRAADTSMAAAVRAAQSNSSRPMHVSSSRRARRRPPAGGPGRRTRRPR